MASSSSPSYSPTYREEPPPSPYWYNHVSVGSRPTPPTSPTSPPPASPGTDGPWYPAGPGCYSPTSPLESLLSPYMYSTSSSPFDSRSSPGWPSDWPQPPVICDPDPMPAVYSPTSPSYSPNEELEEWERESPSPALDVEPPASPEYCYCCSMPLEDCCCPATMTSPRCDEPTQRIASHPRSPAASGGQPGHD
jgi:hypothetical protein